MVDSNTSPGRGFQEITPIKLDVSNSTVQEFCSEHHITAASLFQTAWAIVIGCYAGVEDVSFGYSADDETSRPNGATEGSLICRAQVTAGHRLLDTMIDMMKSFDRSLSHRGLPSAEILKAFGLEGQPLFRSGLLIQHHSGSATDVFSNCGQVPRNEDLMEVCIISCEKPFQLGLHLGLTSLAV